MLEEREKERGKRSQVRSGGAGAWRGRYVAWHVADDRHEMLDSTRVSACTIGPVSLLAQDYITF